MKRKISIGLFSCLVAGAASADSLYYVGSEAQESLPLKWVIGANVTWDDNVAPGGAADGEDSVSINPYVGLSFVNITPQTTWDVYVRLGLIYYFDQPDAQGADDVYTQSRAGVNLTHRFSERLRFSSRNFLAYELEPDYSQGFSSTRQIGEYFYWETDNSIGYRWTERFATYSGFTLSGVAYDDVENADRFTWTAYTQGRYQLGPQTVLTADYRYSQTEADGVASDSTDQFLLAGVEHRFSPNTIAIASAGAQFRDVDDGDSSTSPYLELALNSQINEQFRLRGYARYGMEVYDTVQVVDGFGLSEFDERRTLRIGINGEYSISPMFSVFGGVDYIPTSYEGGRTIATPESSVDDQDEDIVNAYVGLSVKFTDYLFGTLSYNYTDSSSDLPGRDYDRNRVSVGVRAEF